MDFVHIIKKLQVKAEEDGKVSSEEEKFIASLTSKVEEYQNAVEEAYQDDFISEDEFHDIVILRDAILTEAMDFNTESGDVNALIQELFDEINKHEIPGMVEDELIKSDEENDD